MIKRTIDFIMALVFVTICLPFFIIYAFLYWAVHRRSALVREERVGRNNKTIYLYKFRPFVNGKQHENATIQEEAT